MRRCPRRLRVWPATIRLCVAGEPRRLGLSTPTLAPRTPPCPPPPAATVTQSPVLSLALLGPVFPVVGGGRDRWERGGTGEGWCLLAVRCLGRGRVRVTSAGHEPGAAILEWRLHQAGRHKEGASAVPSAADGTPPVAALRRWEGRGRRTLPLIRWYLHPLAPSFPLCALS